MTTSNIYRKTANSKTSSSTNQSGISPLNAIATMAASTLKVVAALNTSVTTAAALAVAQTTGALASYMADSQHHSSAYAHPYHSSYTAGNSTIMTNGNTNINTILYHNTNTSTTTTNNSNNSSSHQNNNLNASNYNTSSISLLTPTINMTHHHLLDGLYNVNSTFGAAGGINSNSQSNNNSSLVDGLMVDHLPLQLITSTASSKVNLDIEIDIQLLTSDYEGSTVSGN